MTYDGFDDDEWVEDEGDEHDCLLQCPSCHATVHEDTQQCQYCGDWIVPVYPRHPLRKLVFVGCALLLVLALILLTVR